MNRQIAVPLLTAAGITGCPLFLGLFPVNYRSRIFPGDERTDDRAELRSIFGFAQTSLGSRPRGFFMIEQIGEGSIKQYRRVVIVATNFAAHFEAVLIGQ